MAVILRVSLVFSQCVYVWKNSKQWDHFLALQSINGRDGTIVRNDLLQEWVCEEGLPVDLVGYFLGSRRLLVVDWNRLSVGIVTTV
jgi:hypothetical protein